MFAGIFTALVILCLRVTECVDETAQRSSLSTQLIVEPDDSVVVRRRSLLLNCVRPVDAPADTAAASAVAAEPRSSVSWRLNGSLLAAAEHRRTLSNGSLLLENVDETDVGKYQCEVPHSHGTLLSIPATVQLAELSVSSTDPSYETRNGDGDELAVFTGDTAVLTCGVDGRPVPHVRWLKDDQPLTLDHSRMSLLPSRSLEIGRVLPGDDGDYACRAASVLAARDGPTHRLRISVDYDAAKLVAAPWFVSRPVDTVAHVGDDVVLECAANGHPQPVVSWLKNGNTIDMSFLDRRFFLSGVSSLHIVDVRPQDAGMYQCRAVNSQDSTDAAAQLSVHVAPEFITTPTTTTSVLERQDVQLSCQARGTPTPTVTWTRNGRPLSQSNYVKLSSSGVRILGVLSRDTGVYQCFASNTVATVQAMALLTVKTDPETKSSAADEESDEHVEGPGANIPSLPPGLTSSASSGHQLSAPRNVTARDIRPRSLTISWLPPDWDHEDVEDSGDVSRGDLFHRVVAGYSVIFRVVGSDRERVVNVSAGPASLKPVSVLLDQLQPHTEYAVRVQCLIASSSAARRSLTIGGASDVLLVRTAAAPAAASVPRLLRAVPVTSTRIALSWQPVYPTPLAYVLTIAQTSGGRQLLVRTNATQYIVGRLRAFTEYRVTVAAEVELTAGGGADAHRGPASPPVVLRTFSDVPSETPSNVTLDATSDTSILVRWQPPPADHWNGQLTGYKLRYRVSAHSAAASDGASTSVRRAQSVVTDASRRQLRLTGLLRRAEYSVKLAALTVNGTGPYTRWRRIRTAPAAARRQESAVPGRPAFLRARPTDSSVTVVWAPPRDRAVRVRGYTVGWGLGVADSQTHVLPADAGIYVVRSLRASSEYVISVRAWNAAGNGTPIYETVWTRVAAPSSQMSAGAAAAGFPSARQQSKPGGDDASVAIPTGVKVSVVSDTELMVEWTDRSLLRQDTQLMPPRGTYRVRYTRLGGDATPHYVNASRVSALIDQLRPDTAYEFSVQAVRDGKASDWSMIEVNRTREARPASPPRDLTVVQSQHAASMVILNWQPPRHANGKINGYIIHYSRKPDADARAWRVQPVLGGQMTASIGGLTADTDYWFRVQARNSAGNGPLSPSVKWTTTAAGSVGVSSHISGVGGGGASGTANLAYLAGACAVGGVLAVTVLAAACLCRRRRAASAAAKRLNRRDSKSAGYMKGEHTQLSTAVAATGGGGGGGGTLKPPDLWLHHGERTELRCSLGSSSSCSAAAARRSDSCSTLRGHVADFDGSQHASTYVSSTLDVVGRRRAAAAVAGRISPPASTVTDSYRSDNISESAFSHRSPPFKPPPIRLPLSDVASSRAVLTSTAALMSGGGVSGAVETRPLYLGRAAFNLSRGLTTLDPPPPPAPVCPESHYGAVVPACSSTSGGVAGTTPGTSVSAAFLSRGLSDTDTVDTCVSGCGGGGVGVVGMTCGGSAGGGYTSSIASTSTCSGDATNSTLLHKFTPAHLQHIQHPHPHPHHQQLNSFSLAAGQQKLQSDVQPRQQAAETSSSCLMVSPLRRPPAFAGVPACVDHAVNEQLLPLRPSYSTEELSQEMANLEGLMKDLSAITESEFQC